MALTREFKQTILERASVDVEFRQAMLAEAVNEFIGGDLQVAKSMLRDYINATVSFEPLAKELDKNSKSIQRMLSAKGNPTAQSLCEILHVLQEKEGVHLKIHLD